MRPLEMFRGDLLIDGYNLLHAAGLSRRSYGPGEFERTRRRLLKLLAGQLFDRERHRTTVVFDAPGTGLGPSPPSLVDGIHVVFAGGDGDADVAIERLIRLNSAPRRLHVISSDHRLQRAARRRRAKFYDSDEFLRRIARRPTPQERARIAEPDEKRHGLSSPGEVEAWLKAFGPINAPPDHPATRPQPDPPATENVVSSSDSVDTPADETPDTTSAASGPGEVAFWEARIAQLWQQTQDDDNPSGR